MQFSIGQTCPFGKKKASSAVRGNELVSQCLEKQMHHNGVLPKPWKPV